MSVPGEEEEEEGRRARAAGSGTSALVIDVACGRTGAISGCRLVRAVRRRA